MRAHSSLALVLAASTWVSACGALQSPAPASPEAPAPIVRVFLLAGQSNMEGHAVVDLDDERDYNGGRGNLAALLADPLEGPRWSHLRAPDGSWATRGDVFVSYRTEEEHKRRPLSVGLAVYSDKHHFGPELGLGHVLGARFDEPVLLVKTAWGGKSLFEDFRPPSAGGARGPCYTQMLDEFRAALSSIGSAFPQLSRHVPRVEGVFWFQGWNDGCDDAATAEYEQNLVYLVRDLRAELGDARLPFVVGETGNIDNALLRAAQQAACGRPEVGGGTRFVPTAAFRRKPEDSPNPDHGHHWFGNAESYLLIGTALGHAMIELVDERSNAPPAQPLIDFGSAGAAKEWMTVNDGVMGGKSKGGFAISSGQLVFSGATNTDGGGFSSIRTTPRAFDLGRFEGFLLRVRGDGRTYKFDVRMESSGSGRDVAYRADFPTVAGTWTEAKLPFSSFRPSWRGVDLEGQVPRLDPAKLSALGFMIYDGKDGAFRLEVESIQAYAAPRGAGR